MKRVIRATVDPFAVVNNALHTAIESGMNKTDKWCSKRLSKSQRHTLAEQIKNYFWLALDEAGVELK